MFPSTLGGGLVMLLLEPDAGADLHRWFGFPGPFLHTANDLVHDRRGALCHLLQRDLALPALAASEDQRVARRIDPHPVAIATPRDDRRPPLAVLAPDPGGQPEPRRLPPPPPPRAPPRPSPGARPGSGRAPLATGPWWRMSRVTGNPTGVQRGAACQSLAGTPVLRAWQDTRRGSG